MQWVNCEPAHLPSWRTIVVSGSVSGPHWTTRKSMGHRHFGAETRAGPSPQSGQSVGKAGPTWHFPALLVALRKRPPLPWALLRPGGRVWGPSLWSLQTDYLAPGGCFQSSVSKGESWSQRLGPLVGEEKAGQVRPLGPALAHLSRGPALSGSQDEGQTA